MLNQRFLNLHRIKRNKAKIVLTSNNDFCKYTEKLLCQRNTEVKNEHRHLPSKFAMEKKGAALHIQLNYFRINVLNATSLFHGKISYCWFTTSATWNIGYKLKNNIRDCYSLFNLLRGECTQNDLKEAYIRLAKVYHPDGGTSTACPRKFAQIQEAYTTVKEDLSKQNLLLDGSTEDEDEFDFPYKLPQHRQYLGNEGIGYGTPSQRQNQYHKYKVHRAADVVYEYRMNKNISGSEDALVAVDKKLAKKNKISNTIERMVEDLVQESMSKGEFDNLPGKGRPLDFNERNPMVDTMTHNINKILISNGYAPEWITLEKEIREDLTRARGRLSLERKILGDPPWSVQIQRKWNQNVNIFENNMKELNEKIMKFNMIVPTSLIQKQRIPYNVEKEVDRVLRKYLEFLPPEQEESSSCEVTDSYYLPKETDPIKWSELWKHIKDSFRSLKY